MSSTAQTWQARVRSGVETIEITVTGGSEDEARRSAGRLGQVISIRRMNRSRLSSGMNRTERFVFLMRMSTMISSRFPVSDALRLMISSFSGKIRDAARTALPLVERGMTLCDALAFDVKNFPGSVGLLIKSGTAGGDTGKALRDAAEFEQLIGEASKGALMSILRSFLYMFIALGMLLVNQYMVVPAMFDSQIMKMAKDADFSLWRNIGLYFIALQGAILGILTILIIIATIGRRFSPDKMDGVIIKIPVMRDIVISKDNFIGLYRLCLLVRAGVPMNECLLSCAESSRPGALREDFKRAYAGLRRGEKWSKYMKTLHLTDRATLMMMPDQDELAKNLGYMADQSKTLYLERLKIISPILDVISASMISIAGFIILIVSTIPQLQLVSEIMG